MKVTARACLSDIPAGEIVRSRKLETECTGQLLFFGPELGDQGGFLALSPRPETWRSFIMIEAVLFIPVAVRFVYPHLGTFIPGTSSFSLLGRKNHGLVLFQSTSRLSAPPTLPAQDLSYGNFNSFRGALLAGSIRPWSTDASVDFQWMMQIADSDTAASHQSVT